MVDSRFFDYSGQITLKQLVDITGVKTESIDKENLIVKDVAPLDKAGISEVSFLDNIKYVEMFSKSKAGFCFVDEKHKAHAPDGMILLITKEPYHAFALASQQFYPPYKTSGKISSSANIAETAKIGKNCDIAANAFIAENVEIGDNCSIGVSAVIERGVIIGNDSSIGANSSISHSVIGERVIIHRGVNIGQDGFGFALGAKGHIKVPQLGKVIIENDVEIGSGTCIDRGSAQDTIIGAGTKIDNLVQIGHNVVIGKNSIIVAQVGIAGSTHIGNGAVIGGQVGVAGHLKIGNGVKIAACSGVMTNIADGQAFGGSPAVPIRNWHKQTIALTRLGERKGAEKK